MFSDELSIYEHIKALYEYINELINIIKGGEKKTTC